MQCRRPSAKVKTGREKTPTSRREETESPSASGGVCSRGTVAGTQYRHIYRGARGQLPAVRHISWGLHAARAPELKGRLCCREQNSRGSETAVNSGGSTASTEPSCTPRCLSRRSSRRRRGKVAEALCPYTPYGQRRAGACVLSYILPAMTSSSAAGSVVKNCC